MRRRKMGRKRKSQKGYGKISAYGKKFTKNKILPIIYRRRGEKPLITYNNARLKILKYNKKYNKHVSLKKGKEFHKKQPYSLFLETPKLPIINKRYQKQIL